MDYTVPVARTARTLGSRLAPLARRYVRRLWEKRGGGFYGFVATLMFLYLEVINIAGDIVALNGMRPDLAWIVGFIVSNLVELVINTVRAAIWPLIWLQQFGVGVLSAVLLGVVYVAYLAVRPQVMRWLQEPDDVAAATVAARPLA